MKFTVEVIALIKNYILYNVSTYPNDITSRTCDHFGISKPTVLKYLKELIEDRILKKTGSNRYPKYELVKTVHEWEFPNTGLEEDILWRETILPLIKDLDENVKIICQYGFTEMVNNVIDHSCAKNLHVCLREDFFNLDIYIIDDGVGIFEKIKGDLGLADPKHSILELTKGKFTSDPTNHSGEGIFFTSRAFDAFCILSHKLRFSGFGNKEGVLWEIKKDIPGTGVLMRISKKAKTKLMDIFNEYADPDKDPSFHKTIIPVKLMEHEGELLLSRSQAKRLILRFDRFTEVILDFEGVTQVGQAFADEVFRVFKNKYPEVHLSVVNTVENVENMIKRVVNSK